MAASPTWFQHPDLMQAAIVILAAIVAFFAIRALRKIDANQTNLFIKYDNHETRLSHLEGQHEARTALKIKC